MLYAIVDNLPDAASMPGRPAIVADSPAHLVRVIESRSIGPWSNAAADHIGLHEAVVLFPIYDNRVRPSSSACRFYSITNLLLLQN
jgi:hypothetical protein